MRSRSMSRLGNGMLGGVFGFREGDVASLRLDMRCC
jgi:hypothetical protein